MLSEIGIHHNTVIPYYSLKLIENLSIQSSLVNLVLKSRPYRCNWLKLVNKSGNPNIAADVLPQETQVLCYGVADHRHSLDLYTGDLNKQPQQR